MMGKNAVIEECSRAIYNSEIDLLNKKKVNQNNYFMAGFLNESSMCSVIVLKDGIRQSTMPGLESKINHCSLLKQKTQEEMKCNVELARRMLDKHDFDAGILCVEHHKNMHDKDDLDAGTPAVV